MGPLPCISDTDAIPPLRRLRQPDREQTGYLGRRQSSHRHITTKGEIPVTWFPDEIIRGHLDIKTTENLFDYTQVLIFKAVYSEYVWNLLSLKHELQAINYELPVCFILVLRPEAILFKYLCLYLTLGKRLRWVGLHKQCIFGLNEDLYKLTFLYPFLTLCIKDLSDLEDYYLVSSCSRKINIASAVITIRMNDHNMHYKCNS